MKPSKARLEAAALFVMVFLLGVTFGAVGNRIWNERVSGEPKVNPKPTRDQILQNLTQLLQLTAEQQKQVGADIDDTRAQFQALSEKWQTLSTQHDSQREVILQQYRGNVRAILTPEQRVKYDEYLKRRDEQRKKEAENQAAH